MKTITVTIYSYEELSPEAQNKAREWYKEGDEHPLLTSDMDEYAFKLLKKYKIQAEPENIKVYYSLSYSQGDGAMIEFSDAIYDKYTIDVKQRGRYTHERSTYIEIQETDNLGFHTEDDVIKNFEENVYIPMCKELTEFGYDTIESLNSDAFVADALISNDYQFYKDGSLFKG